LEESGKKKIRNTNYFKNSDNYKSSFKSKFSSSGFGRNFGPINSRNIEGLSRSSNNSTRDLRRHSFSIMGVGADAEDLNRPNFFECLFQPHLEFKHIMEIASDEEFEKI
jgi:hypothetical protein